MATKQLCLLKLQFNLSGFYTLPQIFWFFSHLIHKYYQSIREFGHLLFNCKCFKMEKKQCV